ncbi:hypothetical protein BST61_g7953 [Cercospora zeina]
MASSEALPRTHFLSLPPEVREEIYRLLLHPAANRTVHADEYITYNYAPALQLLLTNRLIYIEARKVFYNLNQFVRIETPWPEARNHVATEGHVPIIMEGRKAAKFDKHIMTMRIDAPQHSSLQWDIQNFVILADDVIMFADMWMYSGLTHPGLNEHLRLILELRDPYAVEGEEEKKKKNMSEALQRKLLLPFGVIKNLNAVSKGYGTVFEGDLKPSAKIEKEMRALQAEPYRSPEHCLREATRLKFEGNAELAKRNFQGALKLYDEAWKAIHIVVMGRQRHIHADAFFARELREEPYMGKNGQTERLMLRIQLVANTCEVYLRMKEWDLCQFWGMRTITILRDAMELENAGLLAPEDEAVPAFPAAAQMGKIYYRTAIAYKELGEEHEARRLLRVARVYLPDDEAVKREVAATALSLGGPSPQPRHQHLELTLRTNLLTSIGASASARRCRLQNKALLLPDKLTTSPELSDVERVRKLSQVHFSDTSFRNKFQQIAFSSYVKRALDPPEARTTRVTNSVLREFLVKKTVQQSRTLRSDPEYDALHFDIPPTPDLASSGYDEIHLRNVFNHDIAFAAFKHTRAEMIIQERLGLVIEYSVADAHFITILSHLRNPSHDPELLEGPVLNESYEVYHDHRNGDDIETQYLHLGIEDHLALGAEIPEHDLPHVEALHDVYKRPYYVRRIEDINFIKSWESLTKSNCMMWYARDLRRKKSVWVTIFFYDMVLKTPDDGEALWFVMDYKTVDLPYHCDLDGIRRWEAIDAEKEFERAKAEAEARRAAAAEAEEEARAAKRRRLDKNHQSRGTQVVVAGQTQPQQPAATPRPSTEQTSTAL